MQDLVAHLPLARRLARAPLSSFKVGAVVEAESGSLYLGANIELPEAGLGFTLHAEQTAVINAWSNGESGIRSIATTAVPCGHCRQFLYEVTGSGKLVVRREGQPAIRLSKLLPSPFGPRDLGLSTDAFSRVKTRLQLTTGGRSAVAGEALQAAINSYAPVSQSPSGVALETAAGKIYTGAYLECVTLNPSVTPMLSAIARMILAGDDLAGIRSAALVEIEGARITQYAAAQLVLEAIAPRARLKAYSARIV